MANSSSFIRENAYWKNMACYGSFRQGDTIIIEEEKFVFGKEILIEYLEELKKILPCINWVFETRSIKPYTYSKSVEELNITGMFITLSEPVTRGVLLFATTSIRFYWEGKYVECDHQYLIFKRFMEMCKMFPNNNRLQLLCIAHNIFRHKLTVQYPAHLLSNNVCKIIDQLNMNSETLFGMFTDGNYMGTCQNTTIIPEEFDKIAEYTYDNYKELMNYFKVEIVE